MTLPTDLVMSLPCVKNIALQTAVLNGDTINQETNIVIRAENIA